MYSEEKISGLDDRSNDQRITLPKCIEGSDRRDPCNQRQRRNRRQPEWKGPERRKNLTDRRSLFPLLKKCFGHEKAVEIMSARVKPKGSSS